MKRLINENKIDKLISECKKFELDLDRLKINWTLNPNVSVEYSCQIVGTRTYDGQFLWAWGNPSIPENARMAAQKVQVYGNKQNFIELMDRRCFASLSEAANFLCIASFLNNADGTWMGDYGDGTVYLIYNKTTKEYKI